MSQGWIYGMLNALDLGIGRTPGIARTCRSCTALKLGDATVRPQAHTKYGGA